MRVKSLFKEKEKIEHEKILVGFKYLKKTREIFKIYSENPNILVAMIITLEILVNIGHFAIILLLGRNLNWVKIELPHMILN